MSLPPHLRDAIASVVEGRMPAEVAVMHLAAACRDPSEWDAAVAAIGRGDAHERALHAVAQAHPDAFALTHDMLSTVSHVSGAHDVDEIAAMFDRAVRRSPAGSVALYSLGDEGALARATEEVVDALDVAGLLRADADLLDLGCGIGRFLVALAPRLRRLVGLDVSPAMIDEARRRCAAFPNVACVVGSGRDLAPVPDASVDLVLAADVFPYLMQIGAALTQAHVVEAARVLRPGGAMAIFNFSYRGDPAQDEADLARMATGAGLLLDLSPPIVLRHWDARAFVLRRSGTDVGAAH